ncbi:alanine racemase [Porticoccaceae bacterium LTM1]|nr:alanine racemase [Porticoccaceae bacterium LTM1]
MARYIQADISRSALQHNFNLIKSCAGNARIVAIIKANGYGHGAVEVARSLPEADIFGVACIEEALELVESGIQQPVLLLEGFFEASELPEIAHFGFEVVIHSREQLDKLLAANLEKPIVAWLKHDSGMHRLGFTAEEFRDAYRDLDASANVSEIRLMSHLACADDLGSDFTDQQLQRFAEATKGLPGDVSLANSAGLLAWPDTRGNWVRPGLVMYGCSPFNEAHGIADQLQPVMTVRSKIMAIHNLEVGEGLGYGQSWKADKPTRVGTVAAGYGDGYPRHAQTGTPMLVNGQRTRLLGRVSMDMLSVDLSDLPDAKVGDPVVLWGEASNGQRVSAVEVAAHADTIVWVLLTGITARVPLVYK